MYIFRNIRFLGRASIFLDWVNSLESRYQSTDCTAIFFMKFRFYKYFLKFSSKFFHKTFFRVVASQLILLPLVIRIWFFFGRQRFFSGYVVVPHLIQLLVYPASIFLRSKFITSACGVDLFPILTHWILLTVTVLTLKFWE